MGSHPNPSSRFNSLFTTKEKELGFPTLSLSLLPGPASRDDDASSIISISMSMSMSTTAACEGSGSNSSGLLSAPAAKRMPAEAASSSARFKGVVLQQNGHWGAQIYAHHSRIWLGTFKTERAAARAYDSAAIKLQRGDSHRNFPWSELTAHEPTFQEMFSTEAVLDMIRDGSYEVRFAEYLRRITRLPRPTVAQRREPLGPGGGAMVYKELFQKELTPSDVGKLNRLVIPKKYATKCLPEVSEQTMDEVLVEFVDPEGRVWAFRYCYWKSSQSYVFTKGWNKFVKEKRLKAKDVVAFYYCQEREGLRREYRMIDIVRDRGSGVDVGRDFSGKLGDMDGLAIGLRKEVMEASEEEGEGEGEVISESVVEMEGLQPQVKKHVKLFGICID